MPTIKINNNERVAIIGMTGSGKSELIKHFLRPMNRILVIDPKHTFKLDGFSRARKLPMFGNNFKVIYRPRWEDDFDLSRLIARLNKMRDVTIYVDELSTITEQFPETIGMLADVVRTGRERRVAVWSAMQRPRWIPRIFLSEAEVFFQFFLNAMEDKAYMAQYIGREVLEDIEFHDFWYRRPGEKFPSLLRLDLKRDIILPIQRAVAVFD